jgi:hypothetical protein
MPLTYFLYAFLLAVSAWAFVNILEDEDMIFCWWSKLICKLPKGLSKPLGGCDLCMAGQFGLWGYFFLGEYKFYEHIFFIVLTIFFVKVIDRIIWGT